MGHFLVSFLYFRLFNTIDCNRMLYRYKSLPMTGLELRTYGVRRDCSTNWDTTNANIFGVNLENLDFPLNWNNKNVQFQIQRQFWAKFWIFTYGPFIILAKSKFPPQFFYNIDHRAWTKTYKFQLNMALTRVTRKKSPNVCKTCPKMISLQIW